MSDQLIMTAKGTNGALDADAFRRAKKLIEEKMDSDSQPVSAAAAPSLADELQKLAQLRDQGILSDVEFEAQKAKLLA